MRVLILGGTAEARDLAFSLVRQDVEVETSLAGRVANPRLPVGAVRIGGFGGAAGLAAYARDFDAVVDATHPFAATISRHAAAVDIPLLRLERPGWAGDFERVATHAEAAAAAAGSRRPFLTTGRQTLGEFVSVLADHPVLVRVVDEPDLPPPPAWTLLRARGPYTLAGERELMAAYGVDALVTKDSGGDLVRAKLDAAAELGVRVVMVDRPAVEPGVRAASCVEDAVGWCLTQGLPTASTS